MLAQTNRTQQQPGSSLQSAIVAGRSTSCPIRQANKASDNAREAFISSDLPAECLFILPVTQGRRNDHPEQRKLHRPSPAGSASMGINTSKRPCGQVTRLTCTIRELRNAGPRNLVLLRTSSTRSREHSLLFLLRCFLLQSKEGLFVVAGNDAPTGCPDELLQSLRRSEPRRVVASKPTLRNTVPPLSRLAKGFSLRQDFLLTFSMTWQ